MRKKRFDKKRSIRKRFIKSIIGCFSSLIIIGIIFAILVLYGPFIKLRALWVTTAMTTLNHQWLATDFISGEEISRILNSNRVENTSEKSDTSLVKTEEKAVAAFNSSTNNDSTSATGTDNNGSNASTTKEDEVQHISISGSSYKGSILLVKDPSKVSLAVCDNFAVRNTSGMRLKKLIEKYNGRGGINAGGYEDANGKGLGSMPIGVVIQDGTILYDKDSKGSFTFVGFTKDNVLVTGNYTFSQIKNMNLRDGVSFGPALIVNGKPTKIYGDGGWGIAPRTAIGQREDGTVIMLTIDGRQPLYSLGASMKEVQNIMIKYGAVNACNLDGGSSTVIELDGKTLNKPSGPMGPTGGRTMPTAFIIKK